MQPNLGSMHASMHNFYRLFKNIAQLLHMHQTRQILGYQPLKKKFPDKKLSLNPSTQNQLRGVKTC